MNAWPLMIALPVGARADYVPGTQPPQYTIAGALCAIDVEIPDDLAAHWFWFGSCLVEDTGLRLISTATYPPPGWPSVRGTCFDVARRRAGVLVQTRMGI